MIGLRVWGLVLNRTIQTEARKPEPRISVWKRGLPLQAQQEERSPTLILHMGTVALHMMVALIVVRLRRAYCFRRARLVASSTGSATVITEGPGAKAQVVSVPFF